jgi:hypothetical protein
LRLFRVTSFGRRQRYDLALENVDPKNALRQILSYVWI